MLTRSTIVLLLAIICAMPASAQAPVAGSGALPAIDPFADSPREVVEAVKKFMGIRKTRTTMLRIKVCFRESRLQIALRQVCRQRLETYFRDMLRMYPEIFSKLQPLEVYIQFVTVAADPDVASIRRDLFALRGIVTEVRQAQAFQSIKDCFKSAGPQPAMQQICRQRIDAFHAELMRTRGQQLRDVSPAAIKRRLVAVATVDQVGGTGGDLSAFQSLRNIRKAQQEKKAAARLALDKAKPYYCQSRARVQTLRSRLAETGICICTYGRRYAASTARQRTRAVRVASSSCTRAGRFRVRDLNGGSLRHGDWVTLRAAHNGYLSMSRDGVVYANRDRAGKFEKFRIIRATNLPGLIRPGELIVLVSARGVFVVPDLKFGRMKATKEKPKPHEYFVFTP